MSTVPQPEYYLLWKGRQSGPFSLAVIREQLDAGEINRMHQVGVSGRWIVLGEFLEQQDGGPIEARRRAEAAQQQAEAGATRGAVAPRVRRATRRRTRAARRSPATPRRCRKAFFPFALAPPAAAGGRRARLSAASYMPVEAYPPAARIRSTRLSRSVRCALSVSATAGPAVWPSRRSS